MIESEDNKKLEEEVAAIDAQMAELAARKRRCLSKLPEGNGQKIALRGSVGGHNREPGVCRQNDRGQKRTFRQKNTAGSPGGCFFEIGANKATQKRTF